MLRRPLPPQPFLPVPFNSAYIVPVVLLFGSNMFMTYAWYGHLKGRPGTLLATIMTSWGIAFFEYMLMVPANRIGNQVYSVVQLKTIQEIVSLTVFAGFSAFYLGQPLRWNQYAAFGLIVVAAFLMFHDGGQNAAAH